MAKKLGDFFRNTMGVPAGKQHVEKELIKPAVIPFEPPPTLLQPAKLPEQKAPVLIKAAVLPELGSQAPKLISPAASVSQPAPSLISPTAPETQGPPKLILPTAPETQGPPVLTLPTAPEFQNAPKLTIPTAPETQGPPVLTLPTAPKFQDPPTLVQPAVIPLEPAPPLLQPAIIPFEPAPPLLLPTPPVFEPPPTLLQPAQIHFEPPPALLVPVAPGFQAPPPATLPKPLDFQLAPALSLTGTIDFQNPPDPAVPPPPPPQPAVPDLIAPRPVNDIGGIKFYSASGLIDPYKKFIQHQLETFSGRNLQKAIQNLAQKSLPKPGNIDPDLLPSTIFMKALNVANSKIQELENKYGYNQIANVGSKVSTAIGGAMGVNYAPGGAYENSSKATSLRLINDELRKSQGFTKANIFDPINTSQLQAAYTENIKSDPKYAHVKAMDSNPKYRLFMDDDNGLLSDGLSVNQAAKGSYFPFYLVDLRPNSQKKYRTVFFQPFNMEIGESFAPSWNTQNFMGRVDPVATYQNTTRTISVKFKMVALHPNDLGIIYSKLKWLTSMVYPEYSPNLRYKSGPVVKLRIGNVINADSKSVPLSSERPGLPGFISSLDYAYDNIWELEDDWQVPRGIDINFSFTVLHELPMGILDGDFGGIGQIEQEKERNVYMTPIELLRKDLGFDATFQDSATSAAAYVDDRSYRSVGPEQPPPSSNDGYGEGY